jgi:hypothetical protein
MNTIFYAPFENGGKYRDLVREHGSPLLVMNAQIVREQ